MSRYKADDIARMGEAARRQIDLALFAAGAQAKLRDELAGEKRSKYGNKRTMLDEKVFDSKAEADRWAELRLLQRAGRITELVCQPEFKLTVNGITVASYFADFQYYDEHGKLVVEDVKSPSTQAHPLYRLKRKLCEACHGIKITEVMAR